MIIQEYKDGDTTIRIDDTYFPKSEEERKKDIDSLIESDVKY